MLTHFNYNLENNYRFLDNPKDKVVGVVLQTKNYSQFHMDGLLNRQLDTPHVRELIKSLKEDKSLVLEPVLVDKSMKIIDGQHRFYALSKLNLPVTYMIDDRISIIDAPVLNSNQKNWSVMDYVRTFSNKGNKNYQLLLEELNRYKTVSTINVIASSFEVGSPIQYGGGLNKKIRDGKYKFDESKKTKNEKFFDFMTLLHQKSGSNHRIPANVQQAIRLWYLNPKVDKNRLIQVIDEELIKRAPRNTSLCAQLIGKKYNTRLRKGKINYYINNKGTFGFNQED